MDNPFARLTMNQEGVGSISASRRGAILIHFQLEPKNVVATTSLIIHLNTPVSKNHHSWQHGTSKCLMKLSEKRVVDGL